MNAFFFVYTVVLILVCFAAAVMALSAYAVSRRRAFLPQACFFSCYIIEITGIFGGEWLSQNLPFDPANYYAIEAPVLRVIMGALILLSMWAMLLDILDVHDPRVLLVPSGVFVACCAVVLALMPYGPLRQWCFYTLRQVFIAGGLAYAARRWRTADDEDYRGRLARHRGSFVALCVLALLVFLEDCLVILVLPIPTADSAWLPLYLSTRNFSENLMMILIAVLCMRRSLQTLMLRFDAPPASRTDNDLERHVNETLPAFAKAHGLSPRETEVLAHVLEGKGNREIAQSLVLAEGTIKTHVHNIMKKTGVGSRDELRQKFWSS